MHNAPHPHVSSAIWNIHAPYLKIRKRLLEKSATAHCRSDHSRLHSASLCVFEHPSTPEVPPRDDYSDPITWWNSNMMQNKAGLPCYTLFETGLVTVLQQVYDEDVSQNAINQSSWTISYHQWRHTRATNCLYSALIRCRNDSILLKVQHLHVYLEACITHWEIHAFETCATFCKVPEAVEPSSPATLVRLVI